MNRALVANLSNKELASLIEGNQDIPRIVVDELVGRFVQMVDNGTIEDGSEDEPVRDDREDEIDELRSTIAEAISVLESV